MDYAARSYAASVVYFSSWIDDGAFSDGHARTYVGLRVYLHACAKGCPRAHVCKRANIGVGRHCYAFSHKTWLLCDAAESGAAEFIGHSHKHGQSGVGVGYTDQCGVYRLFGLEIVADQYHAGSCGV